MDIEKLSRDDFDREFIQMHAEITKDPLKNFVRAKGFINLKPTPAQAVVLKCLFGIELDYVTLHDIYEEFKDDEGGFDLRYVKWTEVQIYEYMTQHKYEFNPEIVKNRINLIIGRRGGKTTIASILAAYCAIKCNWKNYLKKTPKASVVVLSHGVEFSMEVLDILKSFFEESPVLSRLIDPEEKNTQRTFNLKVPFIGKDGKTVEYSKVQIKVGAASKKTTRGLAICALLCDEIAFWNLSENAAERDIDIIRAVRPALLQFKEQGLLIKLSSPGIKQGILFDEYNSKELPDSYINFKAPSWVWNTILDKKAYREEWETDEESFDNELRANFVDSISKFILPEYVDLCTMRGITFNAPDDDKKGVSYYAAIDAAFKNDKFTFCLVGIKENRIMQYIMKSWEGDRGRTVKAYDVAKYIRTVCKDYRLSVVHADQYSFNPLKEIFEKFGITLQENVFTNAYKKKIYFNLKKLIHNRTLDLLDNESMLNEIKQLQVEQSATGTIRIGHPVGGHDDHADALAVATFIATEHSNVANFSLADVAGEDYGIATDAVGRAFTAPSPSMLGDVMDRSVLDNSGLYEKDEKTGEIVKKEEDDDDQDDGGADFLF